MQSIDKIISNNRFLDQLDQRITEFLDKYGFILLRYSIGIVFIWFGALKPFDKSPANELVENTIVFIPPEIFIPILGIWEIAIGLGLIIRRFNRVAIFLLFLQMPGTMLPLILLPEVCYVTFPFVLTLEGQYIIKNLVLISGGIVIGGTVRKPSEDKYY
ncbi:MAG: hypothetical protein HeimC2_20040 [Candidatus Heimdallarchaeota archaeon LC_2]|nr:MAG: hypothetical protein HeimC2_20040 [Candidatus Heimdallarchaeota archaeon LC_2]